MYFFDESDDFFRSPTGAIRQETILKLRLMVQRTAEASVQIVIISDSGAESIYEMTLKNIKGKYDVFEGEAKFDSPDLYWMYFKIQTQTGYYYVSKSELTQDTRNIQSFQITVFDRHTQTPGWIKGGVIYQIFTDRYNKGSAEYKLKDGAVQRDDWGGVPNFVPDEKGLVLNNDFFGGTLKGVIDKLPALLDMGVTCIYLNPIFEAQSNHKYDTGDYMKIDPSFGNEQIFFELCELAAENGIRIICDGVFNHAGDNSRYFNRYGNYDSVGAFQSRQSPYYDWFTFNNWNDDYKCWWGIRLLPSFNTRNEEFVKFITGEGGVIKHWMHKGCAGWRLDVVDELPDEFLYPLCSAVKNTDKDALIIGEVWEDASNKISYDRRRKYLLGGQLDSVMNYPLKNAIISFVKDKNVQILADTMDMIINNYPKPVIDCLMNILGTHDTMRILTVLGGEAYPDTKEAMANYKLSDEQLEQGRARLKIASALQFTLPGVPCIYYGDEAGVQGGADPFNRVCYPWDSEDEDLKNWYRKLASIRKEYKVFKEGKYKLIFAHDGIFSFSRGEDEEQIIVSVNIYKNNVEIYSNGQKII